MKSTWLVGSGFVAGLAVGLAVGLVPKNGPEPGGKRVESADSTSPGRSAPARPVVHRSPSYLENPQSLEGILGDSFADRRFESLERFGIESGRSLSLEGIRELLAKIKSLDDAAPFIKGVIDGLAERSPEEAVLFATELPASPFKNMALAHAINRLAEKDPVGAMEKTRAISDRLEQDNAVLGIAEIWARQSPQAALEWSAQQEDPRLRGMFIEKVAVGWGQTSPEDALKFAASNGLSDEMIGAIVGMWSQREPQKALDWAEAHLRSTGETRPLELAYMNWGSYDAEKALASLRNQNNPQLFNAVAAGLAETLGRSNPKAGLALAGELSDPTSRLDTTLNIFQEWARFAPADALKSAADLPGNPEHRLAALDAAYSTIMYSYPGQADTLLKVLSPDLRKQLRERAQGSGDSDVSIQ